MNARASGFLLVTLVSLASARGNILDEIAPAVVCIGNDAPAEERQAARLIFEALRERSDSALLLSDEQVLATPFAVSGKWHAIAVGSPITNSVLLRYPSYWSLDREIHYAPLGHMPAAPFTETRGFYVGGFGYFFAGRNVGFVEFDRSPFYAAMLFSGSDQDRISENAAHPLRFLIRVTGSTPNGVLLGAERFLESQMLYGLAIGPPRWPRSHDLWNLDDENVKPDLPPWIPKGTFSAAGDAQKDRSVTYLGWLMADRAMYAGFLEVTGCHAAQMWRAKYVTEPGLTDFHRSPHHRASANELLVVKLTNPDDLPKARTNLGGTIPISIGGHTFYKTRNDQTEGGGPASPLGSQSIGPPVVGDLSPTCILPATIAGDPYLILANFERPYVQAIARAIADSLPDEP